MAPPPSTAIILEPGAPAGGIGVVTLCAMDSQARAFNERGETVEGPTSDDLHGLLHGLTASNRFLVVERLDAENDEYYMQAYLRDDGTYWVEYRDGCADAHFRASCHTLQLLVQVFTMWLYRLPGWQEALIWGAWSAESEV